MNRKPITLNMSLMDVVITLAEGNPGALNVMTQIIKKEPETGFFTLLSMDDMDMRGSSIWLGYKDHCKENLDAFMKAVTDRDPAMVLTIINNGGTAVTGGASFRRQHD